MPAFIFIKIMIILILVFGITVELYFLRSLELRKRPMSFSNFLRPIIIRKKNELTVEEDNPYFRPADNFEIVSLDKAVVYEDTNINISKANDYSYCIYAQNSAGITSSSMKVKVVLPEKITIIKQMTADKEIEKPVINTANDLKDVEGIKDVYIRKDASIGELQNLLTENIITPYQLVVDYAAVNLSKNGIYPVKYRFNGQTVEIKVYVHD